MPLNSDELGELEALLAAPGSVAEVADRIRRRFPGLSLTRCEPSDMAGEPAFLHLPRFDLHLVDGSNHCWSLTEDPAMATGIVVVVNKVPA